MAFDDEKGDGKADTMICKRCGRDLPSDAFGMRPRMNIRKSWCKECCKEYGCAYQRDRYQLERIARVEEKRTADAIIRMNRRLSEDVVKIYGIGYVKLPEMDKDKKN